MERLSGVDWQALLNSLFNLNADITQETLSIRVLGTVKSLISAEVTSFDFFNNDGSGSLTGWRDTSLEQTQELLEIYDMYATENPIFIETVVKQTPTAVKITDFLSAQNFCRTNISNEFFKLIRADMQMAITVPVSSDFNLTCLLTRNRTDFSERERLLMNLVTPHIVNAINNSFAFERLNSALETKECGLISANRNGTPNFISEYAALLLQKYFSNEKCTNNSLPETLANWLKKNCSLKNDLFPPKSLKIKKADDELSIRLIHNTTTHEITLLLEEKKQLSPKMLESLGLTKRETEILFWMAQGKTDGEIAVICNISLYTVQKHAQHIYIKLGVETRTAATVKALDVLK